MLRARPEPRVAPKELAAAGKPAGTWAAGEAGAARGAPDVS